MPSVASRTTARPANYFPTDSLPSATPGLPDLNQNLSPSMNTTLRGTMPSIFAATDNLRQFYNGGVVPQYRVFPPKSII